MKKILLSSLIALSSTAFAATNTATTTTTSSPQQANQPSVIFQKANQLYENKDYVGTYNELDRIAKTGNGQAIYNLGLLQETGQGTAKNTAAAIENYKRASNAGYSVASYRLAEIYDTGILGMPKDAKQSRTYLEKASDQGLSDATIKLATLLFAEDNQAANQLALKKIAPLIQQNDYRAMHLKSIYDISNGIKTQNEATVKVGIASLQSLAQKGYIPAMLGIANMLAKGNILNQNLPEAKKIFTALAKENVPQAQESLKVVDQMIADQAAKSKTKAKS